VTCVPGVPALGALGGCPGKRLLWRRTYLTFGKANPPFGFALTRVTVLPYDVDDSPADSD
jgi:hypothetical protein